MSEYVEQLKAKFGYTEELLNFLEKLIPSLIIYYGDEYKELIFTSLFNCEIHLQNKNEDPKTYLNQYFGVNKKWEMPKLSGAFYHNEISVNDNKITAKPIIYVKSIYFNQYSPFDFDNDKNVNTLVHEICHLIKGYDKVKIVDDMIIDSTGLIKDIYSYSVNNGIKEEKNENIGIEEAINEVDTLRIMELMTGRKQEIHGYKVAGYYASMLMEDNEFAKTIRLSQLMGDDNWIQYFGYQDSENLIDNFDILVKSLYVSWSDINTKEKREAHKQKTGLAQYNIEEFIKNYANRQEKNR